MLSSIWVTRRSGSCLQVAIMVGGLLFLAAPASPNPMPPTVTLTNDKGEPLKDDNGKIVTSRMIPVMCGAQTVGIVKVLANKTVLGKDLNGAISATFTPTGDI